MISEANKEILKKRFASFLWKVLGMFVSMSGAFILENIGLFVLPAFAILMIGLVIPEFTKYFFVNKPKLDKLQN